MAWQVWQPAPAAARVPLLLLLLTLSVSTVFLQGCGRSQSTLDDDGDTPREGHDEDSGIWDPKAESQETSHGHFPLCAHWYDDDKANSVYDFSEGEFTGRGHEGDHKCSVSQEQFMKYRCDTDKKGNAITGMKTWCYERNPAIACCCHEDAVDKESRKLFWSAMKVRRFCGGISGKNPYEKKKKHKKKKSTTDDEGDGDAAFMEVEVDHSGADATKHQEKGSQEEQGQEKKEEKREEKVEKAETVEKVEGSKKSRENEEEKKDHAEIKPHVKESDVGGDVDDLVHHTGVGRTSMIIDSDGSLTPSQ